MRKSNKGGQFEKASINEDFSLWLTLFEEDFNRQEFLYHYTSFETACKILYSESLRFSSLSTTNDTVESKPKIQAKNEQDQVACHKLLTHFLSMNKTNIQLLCFSMDTELSNIHENGKAKEKYEDFSGRGFALPRMWAQYGENNTGVCFILNKQKFLNKINNSLKYKSQVIQYGKVGYKPFYEPQTLSASEIKELNSYFSMDDPILDYSFLASNKRFMQYSYFQKTLDWIQENEFRFLAYSEMPIFIDGLSDYLSGIVVGENMDCVNCKIIHILSRNICRELKQIDFNYNGCTIKNIDYKGYDFYE